MRRRTFLVASAATLALPAVGHAEATRVLFIPQSDLAILDPIWTTAYVTRNHGYMVFDTLYGQSGQTDGFKATPQMVAGHTTEDKRQDLEAHAARRARVPQRGKGAGTGLCGIDQPLGARDAFGQALMQRTDELSAPDDRTIVFRLKQPFPLLPDALCHGASTCAR